VAERRRAPIIGRPPTSDEARVSIRAQLQDPEVVHRRRWLTLAVLCGCLFVIVLDNSILNVAIPTLARSKGEGGLGASASELQWIVDSYTLVFAGLLLTAGSLGDRFGRYRTLTIGLVVFGIGSGLSAFSGSSGWLTVTRGLMGVGGAAIMPATLSILTNVFTDPRERGKAIGIWAGCAGLAGLGPIVGGTLLAHFWWGSVFLINLPVVLAGIVAAALFVPDSRDPSTPRLDPLGALLSILSLGSILWAVIEGPSRGWTSAPVLTGMGIGALLLVAFFVWELTYSTPMLDMTFFKDPRFSAASGAIMLTFFALFGMLFVLTQYLQLVLGFSAVKAGVVLVPQALVLMICAPLSSVLTRRWGNKLVVAGGLFLVGICLLLFLVLDEHTNIPTIVAIAALMAVGMGNIMAPATDSIMGSLPRAKAGVGSAVNDTTRQVGGAVGVAVIGSVLSSRYGTSVASKLDGVPADLVDQARNGIGSAISVVLGDPSAAPHTSRIVDAARSSFVDGMHVAISVAAVVILVAAVGVLIWLPARASESER
jgi:EmrB/QacA subfamily drug resistance transporter